MALRRLGHIFENSPHNLAHALHTPPGRMFPICDQGATAQPTGLAFPVTQDPWQGNQGGPWGGGFGAGNAFSSQPRPSQPAYGPNPFLQPAAAATPAQNAYPVQRPADTVSGTDSDTESSFGEDICYDAPEFQGLTPAQISEKIWWGYARAKSTWRKHMHKPVRRVRRVIKRNGTVKDGKAKVGTYASRNAAIKRLRKYSLGAKAAKESELQAKGWAGRKF